MTVQRVGWAVVFATAMAVSLSAQQPAVTIDGDDITITGCVTQVSPQPAVAPALLVWSRSDLMLAGAVAAGAGSQAPVGTTGIAGRVFFWLDEDLSKHVGQRVEIKGDLEDIKKGEIEIENKGEFIEIELDLAGKEEKVRVPTAWLSAGTPRKAEYDIVARKIDVDNVRVLGACNR
jgi:hypothetical protein